MKSRLSFAVLVALALALTVPMIASAADTPAAGGAAPTQSAPARAEKAMHKKRAKHTKKAKPAAKAEGAAATPAAKPAK